MSITNSFIHLIWSFNNDKCSSNQLKSIWKDCGIKQSRTALSRLPVPLHLFHLISRSLLVKDGRSLGLHQKTFLLLLKDRGLCFQSLGQSAYMTSPPPAPQPLPLVCHSGLSWLARLKALQIVRGSFQFQPCMWENMHVSERTFCLQP